MQIAKKKLGIYIHIPFCKAKCAYCDFLSGPADEKVKKAYVAALLNQIEAYAFINSSYKVNTIYFGGGTPSCLGAEDIVKLLKKVYDIFGIHFDERENIEITIEANPGTIDKEKLLLYREVGVNRISFGLQSTENQELKLLGRIHTYEQFEENYRLARECGFKNINIDLMSGLPGQTIDSYKNSLEKLIKLKPEHISAYSLIIEEGTPFYHIYKNREGLPTEDEDREMYHLTKTILKAASYDRYEISNYAKNGFESKHNSSYWKGIDYLGLGLGASSYLDGIRFHNEEVMDVFIRDFEKVEKEPILKGHERYASNISTDILRRLFAKDLQPLDKKAKMEEYMFLGLRMMEGISIQHFKQDFGEDFYSIYKEPVKKLTKEGLLIINNDKITLSEKGIDVSNYVMAEFLLD